MEVAGPVQCQLNGVAGERWGKLPGPVRHRGLGPGLIVADYRVIATDLRTGARIAELPLTGL